MQYYQFHLGDYISHTAHLTPMEDIVYRRLIDLYYSTESPIPNDIPWVFRRLRLGLESTEIIETVLHEFFDLTENGWESHRCNVEIQRFRAHISKQKENGRKGGRPRKQPQNKPNQNPPLTQPITQTEPKKSLPMTHDPLPINHKEEEKSIKKKVALAPDDLFSESEQSLQEEKPKAVYTAAFEAFWVAYGRRGAKTPAYKAWKNLSAKSREQATEAIPAYFQENPDPQFRKHAQGYLNQRVFEAVLERRDAGCLEIASTANPQQTYRENGPAQKIVTMPSQADYEAGETIEYDEFGNPEF